MTTFLRHVFCVLIPLLWAMPASAVAADTEPFCRVDGLWLPVEGAEWRPVKESDQAQVLVPGQDWAPLAPGQTLNLGTTVKTGQARVRLLLPSKEQILLAPESSVLLEEERGVVQLLGDLYYQLSAAFRVRFGTAEATVEGTSFQVRVKGAATDGAAQLLLAVNEGCVAVQGDGLAAGATVQEKEYVQLAADQKEPLAVEGFTAEVKEEVESFYGWLAGACGSILDPGQRAYCYALYEGSPDWCNFIPTPDLAHECRGRIEKSVTWCYFMQDSDGRAACSALVEAQSGMCFSIENVDQRHLCAARIEGSSSLCMNIIDSGLSTFCLALTENSEGWCGSIIDGDLRARCLVEVLGVQGRTERQRGQPAP